MTSINIINRSLVIKNPESKVGQFLQYFWNNTIKDNKTKNSSTSAFNISIIETNTIEELFSHPSKTFLQSVKTIEHNIDIFTLTIANEQEPCWLLGTSTNGVSLRLKNKSALINYWGDEFLLPHIVLAAIIEALRYSGLLCLHAASASINGQGYIFLGKSGTGKTTTLLRAIKSGWSPLAEDTILLDPTTMLAYGWEKSIRLLPTSLQVLDKPLRSHDWDKNFDKFSVPYNSLCDYYATERQHCFPIHHIVQLARHKDNQDNLCQWTQISAIDITKSLWNTVGLPLSERSQQFSAQHIGKLARHSTAWRLELGNINSPLAPPSFQS